MIYITEDRRQAVLALALGATIDHTTVTRRGRTEFTLSGVEPDFLRLLIDGDESVLNLNVTRTYSAWRVVDNIITTDKRMQSGKQLLPLGKSTVPVA